MNAAQARWRGRIVSAFTERLGLKLAGLSFALVLWFIVTSKEPTEEIVPVRLSLTIDSAHVLRDPLPEVRALVAGEGKDLFTLYASPPVIRRDVPRGADSATITLTPDDVEIPANVTVVVRDVQPHVLTVYLTPRRIHAPAGAPRAPGTGGGTPPR